MSEAVAVHGPWAEPLRKVNERMDPAWSPFEKVETAAADGPEKGGFHIDPTGDPPALTLWGDDE